MKHIIAIALCIVALPLSARAEDFTVIAFEGAPRPGTLITGVVAEHDRRRARLDVWETAP